ncbi:hypothetical protein [Sphingobium sp. WCS2017Hpa-17]|uniref:hypothetical protein n=1 Tax=Sphingobium sp. WCS2017Hpa-17 TaxID=3073638 RepID=UPI002889BF1E|nr:hypothetical protein [Sphingobium sp. WCS2017Hpa-17]
MALLLKIFAWGWSVILALMVLGALSDKLFAAALLLLIAMVAILPIPWLQAKRASVGLEGKRAVWTSIGVAMIGLVVLASTIPETAEMKAARIKRELASKTEAAAKSAQEQEEAAEKEKAEAQAAAAEQQKKDEERASGLHCLSSWDGSSRTFVEEVTARMRDPDSFKHYETRIGKIDKKGEHVIIMEYGGRNGFGGMNREIAMGIVDGKTCQARITSLGD